MTGLLQSFLTRGEPLSGIEVAACAPNQIDESTGYQVMRDLLNRREVPPPQAIFCAGDLLAIGAMRACHEAGLRVPDDVSVIGGTGTDVGAYTQPPLTTMAQPMSEMGRRAGLMLLRMINEKIVQVPAERLPCKLIVRSSLQSLPEVFRDHVVD
jgi:LacI family transcriptional regulator